MKRKQKIINVEKIEAERIMRHESQERFCVRLGMKQTTYSALINNGTTTLTRLISIATALHLTPSDLLNEK